MNQPIDTAPLDGTPVIVLNADHPEFGEHMMMWSKIRKRWEGKSFTPMGIRETWWGLEFPQPTHWRSA